MASRVESNRILRNKNELKTRKKKKKEKTRACELSCGGGGGREQINRHFCSSLPIFGLAWTGLVQRTLIARSRLDE